MPQYSLRMCSGGGRLQRPGLRSSVTPSVAQWCVILCATCCQSLSKCCPPSRRETRLSDAGGAGGLAREKSVQQAATMQKEVLEAWQQANRYWADRMQSEMALWADLASKPVSTRSVPEALEAYAKCVSQQMKMTAEVPFPSQFLHFCFFCPVFFRTQSSKG
jgi:hypothetical protein